MEVWKLCIFSKRVQEKIQLHNIVADISAEFINFIVGISRMHLLASMFLGLGQQQSVEKNELDALYLEIYSGQF